MARARHLLPLVVALAATPLGVAAAPLPADILAGCMADHGFAPGTRLSPVDQAAVQSCAQARAGVVVQTDAVQPFGVSRPQPVSRRQLVQVVTVAREPCALVLSGGAGYRCTEGGW